MIRHQEWWTNQHMKLLQLHRVFLTQHAHGATKFHFNISYNRHELLVGVQNLINLTKRKSQT